jgi:hypothetical protein
MSIRCHYVPQFYLNYFIVNDTKLLWVYDKKDVSVRQQQPLNTAVIGDFYISEKDKDGNKDERVEKLLGYIEGSIKPVLDNLVKNPSCWDTGKKKDIAFFLALMHCRVPRTVEMIKEVHEAGLDKALEYIAETSTEETLRRDYKKFFGENEDPRFTFNQFCDWVRNPKEFFQYTINEKHMLGSSFELIETFHTHLMSMNWSLCGAKGDSFFITCDAPLNIFSLDEFGRACFGGGLGLPNVEIVFPLTPKLCIRIERKPLPRYDKVEFDYVNEINKRSICMAEQYIFSPFKSNRIFNLVNKYANSYKMPKIDKEEIKRRLNFSK